MFTLSQSFIPMGICLLILILFVLYRIFVLKNAKPFFPIIAVLLILGCVPYNSTFNSKPIDSGKTNIGEIPIVVNPTGFYDVFEKTENGLIITHKIPCDKTSLLVDDAQASVIYKQYSESRTDYVSFLFTYVGTLHPVDGSENYNLIIHTSQLPPKFGYPQTLENTAPQSSTPATQTVVAVPAN